MRFRYASFIVVLMLLPRSASAGEILLGSNDWGNIWFGDAGVDIQTDVTDFGHVSGPLDVFSDALLEKRLDGNRSFYTFGPGTARFSLGGVSDNFSVEMLSMTMGDFNEDQVGMPTFPSALFEIGLGAGLIPGNLARALGVGTRIRGGSIAGLVEGLEDPYEAPKRFGRIKIDSVRLAVPEPTMMGLLATSAFFAAVRLRRRQSGIR